MADERRSVASAFVAVIVIVGHLAAGAGDHRPRGRHLHPHRRLHAACCDSPRCCSVVYVVRHCSRPTCRPSGWARVGRRVLFKLRNALFTKLQELPLDFFNQNKAGDLISRINNDTDKLNQFLRPGAGAAGGNLFLMAGAAIFLLALNVRLGARGAAARRWCVLVITRLTGRLGQARNVKSLQSLGGMSARDPGEPEQLQGDRRVQSPRLLPGEVQRRRTSGTIAASVRAGPGQQRVRAALRPGVQPGAADRARLRRLPDRRRRSSPSAC